MKLKTLLKFILLTLMTLCFSQYLLAEVSLSIDPASAQLVYGDGLTLSLKIDGLDTALRGFEIELVYDPAFLSIADESAFEEGDFLSQQGHTEWFVRGSAGSYTLSCALMGVTNGALGTGTGTLFSVNLSALNQSTGSEGTDIRLPSCTLRGIMNQDIIVDRVTDANVQIEESYTETQCIDLKYGWNLISSRILPSQTGMESVFAGLKTAGYLVKVQDEQGRAMEMSAGGDWVNNLDSFQTSEGYAVQVNADCSLCFTGDLVALPFVIDLQTGWNIVSYLYPISMDAMIVLYDLENEGKLVKAQSESGASIEKNAGGTWVNNIGNFEPGEGYKIYVNDTAQFIYSQQGKADTVKQHGDNSNVNSPNHKLRIEKR